MFTYRLNPVSVEMVSQFATKPRGDHNQRETSISPLVFLALGKADNH
jgi:hypothetical protein